MIEAGRAFVTYRYITGDRAGGYHTMPCERFLGTYQYAGRIDDDE